MASSSLLRDVIVIYAMILQCMTLVESSRIHFPHEKKTHVQGNIIPVDESRRVSPSKSFVTTDPPACLKKSVNGIMCEEDDEYDEDIKRQFDEAVSRLEISNEMYDSILSKMMKEESISTRANFGTYGDPLCPADTFTVEPKRAMSNDGEWMYVLNQGKMKQSFITEICRNSTGRPGFRRSNKRCIQLTEDGSESMCAQKFALRNMIVLNKKGSLEGKDMLFPSCCLCQITNTIQHRISKFDPKPTEPEQNVNDIDVNPREYDVYGIVREWILLRNRN